MHFSPYLLVMYFHRLYLIIVTLCLRTGTQWLIVNQQAAEEGLKATPV